MSTRLRHVSILSNWLVRASLNCKAPPCFNRSRSRHFLPSTCLRLCSSFGLRPDASNHQVRVCAYLAAQFAFFSRADSGVLLTAINAQASASTFSVNQSAKNVARNQAAPTSRVSSAQDDPHNCFNKLQLRWKCFRAHRDTDLYWSLPEDPASWFKNSVCNVDYNMYSSFLTASPGSVLFSRSTLLKRKVTTCIHRF